MTKNRSESDQGAGRERAGEGLAWASRREVLRLGACGVAVVLLPLPACDSSAGAPDGYAASGRPLPPPAADDGRLPLLWVETGTCTGCSCSLLGSSAPPIGDLLPSLRVEFHETLTDRSGPEAVERAKEIAASYGGAYALIVDGAIPTGAASGLTTVGVDQAGTEYTAERLVQDLAAGAALVVAVGTCASFGGIPGASPNAGRYVSLADALGAAPVRIPGCPPNPGWIVDTVAAALAGEPIDVDDLGRPLACFGSTIHDLCPRRTSFEAADFAEAPGDPRRCLFKVGCKGPMARGDCPTRLWQGRSFCMGANHPCLACTAPGFLDARPEVEGLEGSPASPFYEEMEI